MSTGRAPTCESQKSSGFPRLPAPRMSEVAPLTLQPLFFGDFLLFFQRAPNPSKFAPTCTRRPKRPKQTCTNSRPHALVCELRAGTNLQKFATPRGRYTPAQDGARTHSRPCVQIRVGLDPAEFLSFSKIFLSFFLRFPFFSLDLRAPQREKPLLFWWVFLVFFFPPRIKARVGGSGSGKTHQSKWGSRTFGEGVQNRVRGPLPAWKSCEHCPRKGVREPSSRLLSWKLSRRSYFWKRFVYQDLCDPNRSDFESQIASDCNRNSKQSLRLRKHPLALRFRCDFCVKSLRLRNCDWQSLAICDCDCVGH